LIENRLVTSRCRLDASLAALPLYLVDEAIRMEAEIPAGIEGCRIDSGKLSNFMGKLILARRAGRRADQEGNHQQLSSQRGFDFEAHEVVFVIAFTFQDLDPLVSDQHQQNVGLPNSLVDLGHEIDSWKKRVDIQKDIILVIMFYQDVAQTLDA